MIVEKLLKDGTKAYLVRVGRKPGKQFSEKEWGTRKLAKAQAVQHEGKLLAGNSVKKSVRAEAYADRFLSHMEGEKLRNGRKRKTSTLNTLNQSAKGFKDEFGARFLGTIERSEARDWALTATAGQIKFATQLYNRAIEEGLVGRNVFRGLSPSSKGRSEETPPTVEQWEALRDGWAIHKKYAPMGKALFIFASFTGMRPGELFALEWDDVDFDNMRVNVSRRLYDGTLDLPKSNEVRRIVLTPQARDALLPLERYAQTVFVGKRGQRLSQSTLSNLWGPVKAKAGVDIDFYFASKHRFVHDAYVTRRLSSNAIAQQMGWSEASVTEMLKTYGHGNVGWEKEWEQAYGQNVAQLRAVGE